MDECQSAKVTPERASPFGPKRNLDEDMAARATADKFSRRCWEDSDECLQEQ